jgi:polar amino acid transport system substrate-binding protein
MLQYMERRRKRIMKSRRSLIVLLLAFGLVMAACGDDDSADDTTAAPGTDAPATDAPVDYGLVAPGTLTVCTDAPYPPMEIEVDGEYTGFDIELMRAIAGELGLGLAVVNIGFDPITSGLAMEAGDCDIAAASITILPEREENIDFTDGYFVADQSLLVETDSGITGLADMAGKNIGVQSGTTGEIYANENDPGAAGIISFENPGELFTALVAGTVDGILQDIVPNAAEALENDAVVVIETYPTEEEYGFALQEEGRDALREAVNEALATLRADGTYDAIYDDWF